MAISSTAATSTILAQPFDLMRRSVTGEPTVIASQGVSIDGYSHFAVGAGGTLVYVPEESSPPGELVWHARGGAVLGKLGAPFPYVKSCCRVTEPAFSSKVTATRWQTVRRFP